MTMFCVHSVICIFVFCCVALPIVIILAHSPHYYTLQLFSHNAHFVVTKSIFFAIPNMKKFFSITSHFAAPALDINLALITQIY